MRTVVRLLWAGASWLAITVNLCAAWPDTPFKSSGRWITDASGANVTHAGVNWPGHGEVMIPEGLQHQSILAIVSRIKSLGMNAIRLTYAIEMIDQIYENGDKDVTIESALVNALGQENGTDILGMIIKNNPSLSSTTTRLQVFDAVAAECARQEIYVVLDNHVSKAGWCCNPFDGNSWWGDTHFSITNWTRGLAYMAEHGKSWPALTSMSLRNELRQPLTNWTFFEENYNWETWYQYSKLGADAVHAANPDCLIFLSGMDSSTQFDRIVRGQPLTPGTITFNKADFDGYAEKLALEMHSYSILDSDKPKDCASFEKKLYDKGFETLTNSAVNQFPLLMTEFGFTQDETTWETDKYATCIADYLPKQKVGWFIWVIAGSYYIREGEQGYNESWGLLDGTWSEWRSPEFVERKLKGMVNATLDVVRGNVGGDGEEGDKNASGDDGQAEAGPDSQISENTAGQPSRTMLVVLACLTISVLLSL